MFKFKYKVITKEKTIREGYSRSFFSSSVRKSCFEEGETVLSVRREKNDILEKYFRKNISFGFSKFERIIFFRNVATMMAAGLSLVESLNTSSQVIKSQNVKKVILDISSDIESGIYFSNALKKFPGFFPGYIVETVRLGEVSGTLSDTLDQISVDLEKDYELSRKVTQALVYPVIILLVMIALLLVLMTFVLPKIADLYLDIGADLPFLTRVLLGFGNSISSYPLVYGAVMFSLVVFFALIYKIKQVKYVVHYILLRLPVIKHIIKEFNLVRFFRSLETLVSSGASWIVGVEVAKKTLTNEVYRKAADTIEPVLLHGRKLSEALEPYPDLFPIQSRQILDIGEKTGRLEETLKKVSYYHEKSLDHTIKVLTTMMEPILMLFIGIVIGGIALSVFMPIYQLVDFI